MIGQFTDRVDYGVPTQTRKWIHLRLISMDHSLGIKALHFLSFFFI